jgi:GntR family transcriptional regulator/MocR family aminotransferase
MGWLVLPPALAHELEADREPFGGSPPPLDQLALADLIARGEVDRHLRRQRLRYRRRRDALLAALATELPEVRVRGAAAGLFAVLLLPPGTDEAAATAAATAAGFALEPLRAGGSPAGLAVGYANLPEAAAPAAARLLAHAIRPSFGHHVRA